MIFLVNGFRFSNFSNATEYHFALGRKICCKPASHPGEGGGLLYIFWVRGRAIGQGIDFHDFGIRNGIDFHEFGIRNGITFRDFHNWYRIGYSFSDNWYKVGYTF